MCSTVIVNKDDARRFAEQLAHDDDLHTEKFDSVSILADAPFNAN
jgi:hypothetical protein